MIQRIGENTLSLETAALCCWAAVGGKKEAEGPLGSCFDQTFSDNSLGQESWKKRKPCCKKRRWSWRWEKAGFPLEALIFCWRGIC